MRRCIVVGISIHAAREGGDDISGDGAGASEKFQSTPPVKAATTNDINYTMTLVISIHAAREGGDTTSSGKMTN